MNKTIDFRFDNLVKDSWQLTKKSLGMLIGVIILSIILGGVVAIILSVASVGFSASLMFLNLDFLLPIFYMLFAALIAPLGVGYVLIVHHEDCFKNGQLDQIFNGYLDFKQIFIAAVIIAIPELVLRALLLVFQLEFSLGVAVLVFVLYLFTGFTYLLIAIKKYHFSLAIVASIKICYHNFLKVLLTLFFILVVNVIGTICLLLGLLISLPFSICISYKLFTYLCMETKHVELQIEDNLIQ